MSDIEDRLTAIESLIEQKFDEVLKKLEKSSSTRPVNKKKPAAPKVDQFKLSTQDLLDSDEPLCAYMQRSLDCKGHCGKPAVFSVIRDKPMSFEDLEDVPAAKNEDGELLRRSFNRCNGCKTRAKNRDNSRGYSVVKKFIYKQTGEDTAVAADIDLMMGSPSKKTNSKSKGKKGKKSADSDDDPDVEEGLDDPDPEDSNTNLLKGKKWADKFVKVGKKNMIVRSYTDGRKKDVCIGLIDGEPEDDQYEESLRKPSKTFLTQVGLQYKTPEEASRHTPPKAKKAKNDESEGSDDSEDEKLPSPSSKNSKSKNSKNSKSKNSKSKDDDSDDDSEDEKPPPPSSKGKAKNSKSKAKKGAKAKSDSDDEDEAPVGKGKKTNTKTKGKKGKGKAKPDSDDDEDGEDEEEAFRDMADSD